MSQTMTIIGNIASGKSTLMPILTKALNARAVDADNLFQEKDPFAKPYLADMNRWAFANELWLTLERVKIMRDALKHNGHPLTIVDSGLLMSWVYTHSHLLVGNITEDEWQLYKSVYDELTHDMFHNTSVIRLKYSMDTLMERLKKRGRDYELAFYTREYLGQVEMGLSALEERLQDRGVQVITVDEETITDFEYNAKEAAEVVSLVRGSVTV
jgi:deoxyadenosine/deoxycytidine kinase